MSTEFLPIPSVETATDPIGSPADLRQRWSALMGPLGFGERLLRFAFVGPDRCLHEVLSEVPIGANPTPAAVADVVTALGEVFACLADGSTVAFLVTPPGGGGISNGDRRWAAALTAEADRIGVPIFRANDDGIVLLARTARAA